MSIEEIERLKSDYAAARRNLFKARADALVKKSTLEAAEREVKRLDRDLDELSRQNAVSPHYAELFALATKKAREAHRDLDRAMAVEKEAAEIERRTLEALVGVIPD